ncbi:MAG: hypothetical protein JXB04_00075, partial [Kiritimatiellae bacterium]|nr:hypothetical protein [Kiritimatiellia bacterium]
MPAGSRAAVQVIVPATTLGPVTSRGAVELPIRRRTRERARQAGIGWAFARLPLGEARMHED